MPNESTLLPQYVTSTDLNPYESDKSTGNALANGKIYFWKNQSRISPKDVFQLTVNSMTGNYEYVALPNPITLSNAGTIQDSSDNNVALYYYPFDANGNQELYYIQVFDSNGLEQFTRDAWPYPNVDLSPSITANDFVGLNNIITNPQFAVMNFTAGTTLTIPLILSGSPPNTQNIQIAPGWVLNVTFTATTSVAVQHSGVAGTSGDPFNPPFLLTVTPSANITSLYLNQYLSGTYPNVNSNPSWGLQWGTINNLLSGTALVGAASTLTMNYIQSSALSVPTTIFSYPNTTGGPVQVSTNNTVEISAGNSQNGLTGYDIIQLVLSNNSPTQFGNVQVVALYGSNVSTGTNIGSFDQTPVNRQVDQMFNYYNPLLQAKPIPSYLVGWDFPLNPAQLGATIAAQAVGANKSYYGPAYTTTAAGGWDQTIFFQSVNSGITVSRDTTGVLKTAAAPVDGTQLALIQYVSAPQAIEMLSRRKCVNISANASVATVATVSLWYTKTALPSTIGSNNSIVLTLDADGYPATQNGTWVQVPRSGLGGSLTTTTATNAAKITIATAPTGAANFNQYPLSGWDMQGNTDINSATYFAIVVGTASLAQSAYILWQSISCQDGDIATVPAAKTSAETVIDCQQFFEMSFPIGGTPPKQNYGINTGEYQCSQVQPASTVNQLVGLVSYKTTKFAVPTTLGFYNPGATGAAQVPRDESAGVDCAMVVGKTNATTGFSITCTTGGGSAGNTLGLHWTADCRFGQ